MDIRDFYEFVASGALSPKKTSGTPPVTPKTPTAPARLPTIPETPQLPTVLEAPQPSGAAGSGAPYRVVNQAGSVTSASA